jgi:hypothetical protein
MDQGKVVSMSEAIGELLHDGDTLAIEGSRHEERRLPEDGHCLMA